MKPCFSRSLRFSHEFALLSGHAKLFPALGKKHQPIELNIIILLTNVPILRHWPFHSAEAAKQQSWHLLSSVVTPRNNLFYRIWVTFSHSQGAPISRTVEKVMPSKFNKNRSKKVISTKRRRMCKLQLAPFF